MSEQGDFGEQRPARATDIRDGGGEHKHGFEHGRTKVAPRSLVFSLIREVAMTGVASRARNQPDGQAAAAAPGQDSSRVRPRVDATGTTASLADQDRRRKERAAREAAAVGALDTLLVENFETNGLTLTTLQKWIRQGRLPS